ncbi:similar to Saccharomyces cerevisiae YPL271W ATP15 Epsilon subunit of the F1 sector of mitochondrial F1F0 ATP synthase [Maudiozyma barnettii]|nr:similar to Saccharomyces cerevisiae YPL271W ATP15 Epsilon subunit of the F1 sector of mitochondrial F1F0 ATP synthase [Kazachstania barnettii]
MSAWRKAGLTYTQYISVAAKTLRSALKTELQTQHVLNCGQSDACFTKYEKGSPLADPKLLSK